MKLNQILASATVAAVLGTAGYAVAGAASGSSATPTASSTTTSPGGHPGDTRTGNGHHLRRRIRAAALRVAARTIGITRPTLVQELRAGKTIADVANEHGVQPQAVIDAITQAATTKIEAAKTAGKISAERAAKLEGRLTTIVPKFVNDWHLRAKTS
jgi:transposase-like protein